VWCQIGRSSASVERATRFGLTPVAEAAALLDRSDIVIFLAHRPPPRTWPAT
jgi:hypothetical protein